jgi:hypothetical protein
MPLHPDPRERLCFTWFTQPVALVGLYVYADKVDALIPPPPASIPQGQIVFSFFDDLVIHHN